MTKFCNCPIGAAINNIPLNECPEDFGQIQKLIFQRIYSSGTTLNKFTTLSGVGAPDLLASWTPLLSAADGTKVVQSPYIQNPTNEAGAKKEFGGGNATLGGIPLIIGQEPGTFTAMILQSKQDTIKALKTYMCENVGVYFVDEYGKIGGLTDDINNPAEFLPVPIRGLFVGDKKFGNLDEADSNSIEFMTLPNWSDNFHVITPTDFNALVDLATP